MFEASRASSRSYAAFVDVSAVTALPADRRFAREYRSVFESFQKFAITPFVEGFYFGNHFECSRYVFKPFVYGDRFEIVI